jgi:hypothetical protein
VGLGTRANRSVMTRRSVPLIGVSTRRIGADGVSTRLIWVDGVLVDSLTDPPCAA